MKNGAIVFNTSEGLWNDVHRKAFALFLTLAMAFTVAVAVPSEEVPASPTPDTGDFFSSQLDVNEKSIYDQLAALTPANFTEDDGALKCMATLELAVQITAADTGYLSEISARIFYNAFNALMMESPLSVVHWGNLDGPYAVVSGNTLTGMKVTFILSGEYSADGKPFPERFDDLVAYIEAFCASNPGLSARQAVGVANLKVMSDLKYDPNIHTEDECPFDHSPYSVLGPSKYAVCDGYSKIYQAMCQKFGVVCYMILGYGDHYITAQTEKHAWNLVCLEKGGEQVYYPVDVTWNDSAGDSERYFLTVGSQFSENHLVGVNGIYPYGSGCFEYPDMCDTVYDEPSPGGFDIMDWGDAIICAAIGTCIILALLIYAKTQRDGDF